MATPSVLTVPSMYGDGILYSGPSAYGSELATQPVDLQVDFQAAPSGGVIVDANTFTTSGVSLEGIRSKDAAFVLTVGTAFEIEIRGTTTSNGITLGSLGNSGNEYGSGFGVHRFVSLNNRLWIRQNSAGTTTITHLSIRPLTQGSDFDFTRSTTGTRINEDGYIEDVPYNLVTYSEDFTQWTNTRSSDTSGSISPINTNNATHLIADNTAASSHIIKSANFTISSGQKFTYSLFAKAKEYSYVRLLLTDSTVSNFLSVYFNLSNGTVGTASDNGSATLDSANISAAGNGWYRCSVTGDLGNTITAQLRAYIAEGDNDSIFDGDGTSGILIWGAQIVKGDQPKNYLPTTDRLNLPRLNYPVYGGCPSLLVEPQRTNSIPYSTDFSNAAWTKNEVTVTANSITSPEGITNASLITENSANALHYVGDVISVTSGTTYTASVYAKKKERSVFQWTLSTNLLPASHANYDLDKGVVSATSGAVTAQIIAMPNDWYRCVIIFTATSTNTGTPLLCLQNSPTAARGAAYQGDGSSGLYLYGAQVEAGSYATSLIHTSGSSETRNEDKALYAGLGTTDTFNDSEGVLFIETQVLFNDDTGRGISINAGSGQNRVLIAYPSTGKSSIVGYLQSTAGGGANMNITGIDTTQKHKVAIKYKLNDTSLFIDGVKRAVDVLVAMPVGLKQLDFTNGINIGIAEYRGNLNAIAVYKTALTDTELANLTSYNNHDLFIPYRSRMQMISADQELQCTEHDITRFL